jgi:hypothetical protein
MPFDQWLVECRAIISLGFAEVTARQNDRGAGKMTIHRRKYSHGVIPQQHVDDEPLCWNE